ncbi:hypothetical protein BJ912DRAFT_975452 [Pholiota molesta]|nr:hypothetical protein BJ912DRAFT_975452 [Pholiota molesta]
MLQAPIGAKSGSLLPVLIFTINASPRFLGACDHVALAIPSHCCWRQKAVQWALRTDKNRERLRLSRCRERERRRKGVEEASTTRGGNFTVCRIKVRKQMATINRGQREFFVYPPILSAG